MTQSQEGEAIARFEVENVGGIDETSVRVPPGVTVLAGKNATNRTSFLQAVQAVLGSDDASLKGDAERGHVTLDIGGETYQRELVRQGDHVEFRGGGYLEDPTLADLFAFLLEMNEARQAVSRGDDLREILIRPVDTEEIREEIATLEDEKARINDELADIESLKQELPSLEKRRGSLRDDIEDKRRELETIEAEIDDHNASVEETREDQQRLEEKLGELRETRSRLEDVRYDIESTNESIDSLKQESREVESELAELPEHPMGEHADLDADVERLRDQKQRLEREVRDLQNAVQFNEKMLEDGTDDLFDEIQDDGDAAVTDRLVEDGVVCWTCGSQVTTDDIESTLESLKSVREEKLSETRDIEERLEELESRRRTAQRQQRDRERLRDRLDQIEAQIDDRQTRLEELREQKSGLTDEVEALEAEVAELKDEDFDEVLDLHREANQLEFELERQEDDLADVEDRITEVEREIGRADELRDRREELLDELERCRTRIDQLEADAVEQFNDHIEAILGILEYENLERIWIERLEREVREGRQKVERSVFELHVIRSTENGTVYEDTVEHLSESEREVTGLVFALAGYLAHDVHEVVPFMLLDSLEAIDSERIGRLVDYLSGYADYLVVALLPEDARALDDEYERIERI